MAQLETGSSTSGKANVTATFDLNVREPTTPTAAGLVGALALMDDGALRVDSANTAYARRLRSSIAGHLATGQDNCLLFDEFNSAAVNSTLWSTRNTTQTVTSAGATGLTLNASNITTVTTSSSLLSYRSFNVTGGSQLVAEVIAKLTTIQSNQNAEFGFMNATFPSSTVPTDGIYFRYNASGELRGVICYNATETQTASITLPTQNQFHTYRISISDRFAEFWVNETLRAVIDLASVAPTQMTVYQPSELQFALRYYIAGAPPGVAANLIASKVSVWSLGANMTRPWSHTMAGMGRGAYQGSTGDTQGTTQNYNNSANPVAAVPTNTTAALGTGLGGQFWETDTLAVTTDGIICSYQNPALTASQGRTLYITGIVINSFIQVAITAGGYVAQWSLAFGQTAVSLATAESLTAATKAPRRVAIGLQNVAANAAFGTLLQPMAVRFDTPIVVNQSEFIAVVKKKIGTAPTAGVVGHIISFDGYVD